MYLDGQLAIITLWELMYKNYNDKSLIIWG